MTKRAAPEDRLQRAVAVYLTACLPKPWRWSTFPAGGGGKVRGAQLQAKGLKPGWPDIFILHPDGRWHGIELKAPKGKASEEQIDFLEWSGGRSAICRSIEHVETTLRAWGVPVRGTTVARAA